MLQDIELRTFNSIYFYYYSKLKALIKHWHPIWQVFCTIARGKKNVPILKEIEICILREK